MRRSAGLLQPGQRLLARLAHSDSDQGKPGGKQIDSLVEDLISESIAAGEFENLKGAGEPLPERRQFNPHVDPTTNKMNEILVETVGYSLSDGGSEW